jgi:phosphohistidine phosphatase
LHHKKIFLLRHSDAEYSSLTGTDFDRKLTSVGIEKILQYKDDYLKTLAVDAVFCSTAARAKETLEVLKISIENCSFHKELYEATVEDLIHFIQSISNQFKSILLVGHNPGLSSLASYLCEDLFLLNTCQLIELDLEIVDWKLLTRGIGTEKRNFF